MNYTKFEVNLDGMQTHVWAFNMEQAVIIAQTEAIKLGLSGELISIKECI